MSTQHPDNAFPPSFTQNAVLSGDDEIHEAFHTFSDLDCHEQLWDAEGKETDNFVVKKLLSRHPEFFKKKRLGEDVSISFRVPNPRVEKADAKILLESLHSIPRHHDVASSFYGENTPAPIHQVYVPMTQSAREVLRVKAYYEQYVVKAQHQRLLDNDCTIKEWVGPFRPEKVRVTPLVEDKDAILNAHTLAEELIANKAQNGEDFLRFWFARSDPALNYSSAATVLMLKTALQRLQGVQEKTGVDILPLLGCGSAPFRGNFRPSTVKDMIKGYASVQTFTIQSSFKYDNNPDDVKRAVATLNETPRGKPVHVDEQAVLPIIEKLSTAYRKQVALLAPQVNAFSKFIPRRRKRKLHIGLFGYSRAAGEMHLPRAITFTAAMYSLGLPPEVMGMHALSGSDLDILRDHWRAFDTEHASAARYLNPKCLDKFPEAIQKDVAKVMDMLPVDVDNEHAAVTDAIAAGKDIAANVEKAAKIRGFLG